MTHRDLSDDQIESLNIVYRQVPETLDALPYTDSFETIFSKATAVVPGISKNELHKLMNDLRKAGLLKRKGRSSHC